MLTNKDILKQLIDSATIRKHNSGMTWEDAEKAAIADFASVKLNPYACKFASMYVSKGKSITDACDAAYSRFIKDDETVEDPTEEFVQDDAETDLLSVVRGLLNGKIAIKDDAEGPADWQACLVTFAEKSGLGAEAVLQFFAKEGDPSDVDMFAQYEAEKYDKDEPDDDLCAWLINNEIGIQTGLEDLNVFLSDEDRFMLIHDCAEMFGITEESLNAEE